MKILITGGAGFLGSHLTDALVAQGHEVRILDSLEPPVHQGPWPSYLDYREEVELVRGDVRDPELVYASLRGMDRVIHLAAYQDYLPDYSKFTDVNVRGTALLFETIERYKLPIQKVVIASSQAVYGEGSYESTSRDRQHALFADQMARQYRRTLVRSPRNTVDLEQGRWDVGPRPDPGSSLDKPSRFHSGGYLPIGDVCNWVPAAVHEEEQVSPLSPYGLSKLQAEQTALFLGKRLELPTVALRYSIMQGPRQSFRNAYSGILRAFTLRWLSGKAPVAYEDGEQLRDYLHVDDAVRATLLTLFDDRAQGVFNVPGKQVVSVKDYAESLRETLIRKCGIGDRAGKGGYPPLQIPGLYRVGDTRHIFSDGSRLKALGWEPEHDVARIQRDYVDWVLSLPHYEDHFAAALAQMEAAGVVRNTRVTDD